jgi:sugar lactone lactonase YvrE
MSDAAVTLFGSGLNRAECVLAHRSGLLFCSDSTAGGGVSVLGPDGAVSRILATDRDAPLHPNGIAMEPGGSFLIAHLGAEADAGGVFRLFPDGRTEDVLTEIDGQPLPPTNFVQRDALGRIWVSISTWRHPRHLAYRRDADDGFVILIDGKGARIVADGLGYTNECIVDVEAGLFHINETFGRRISRYRIGDDGALHDRTVVATFGEGVFPDGLSPDAEGGLWVTSVVSNRLIHVTPDGRQRVVLEDSDPVHVA